MRNMQSLEAPSQIISATEIMDIQDAAVNYCMANYLPGKNHVSLYTFGQLTAKFSICETNPDAVEITFDGNQFHPEALILFDHGITFSIEHSLRNFLGFSKVSYVDWVNKEKRVFWKKVIALVIKNEENS